MIMTHAGTDNDSHVFFRAQISATINSSKRLGKRNSTKKTTNNVQHPELVNAEIYGKWGSHYKDGEQMRGSDIITALINRLLPLTRTRRRESDTWQTTCFWCQYVNIHLIILIGNKQFNSIIYFISIKYEYIFSITNTQWCSFYSFGGWHRTDHIVWKVLIISY